MTGSGFVKIIIIRYQALGSRNYNTQEHAKNIYIQMKYKEKIKKQTCGAKAGRTLSSSVQ